MRPDAIATGSAWESRVSGPANEIPTTDPASTHPDAARRFDRFIPGESTAVCSRCLLLNADIATPAHHVDAPRARPVPA